jgi:hypothetical protein
MKTMTVARFVGQHIALSGISQRAIAAACGYRNANIITMIKKGATKLPLNKVAVMASALGTDPGYLLRLVMTESDPEAWDVIVLIMGRKVSITEDEWSLLQLARIAGKGRTPSVDALANREDIAAAIARAVDRDDAQDAAAVTRLEALPRNAQRSSHVVP